MDTVRPDRRLNAPPTGPRVRLYMSPADYFYTAYYYSYEDTRAKNDYRHKKTKEYIEGTVMERIGGAQHYDLDVQWDDSGINERHGGWLLSADSLVAQGLLVFPAQAQATALCKAAIATCSGWIVFVGIVVILLSLGNVAGSVLGILIVLCGGIEARILYRRGGG